MGPLEASWGALLVSLSVLGASWERLERVLERLGAIPVASRSPKGTPPGPQDGPKIIQKSIQNTSDFLIDVLSHFEPILGAFFDHFRKICPNRKRRFYENELLVYTRCSFSRISDPKIYPKINKTTIEKWNTLDRFWEVWGATL